MSIEFKMTFKELKRSLKIYEGYYRTGRIKRMRGITPNRWPSIYKRIGRKRYVTILRIMDDDVFEKTMFGITRWNRH